MTKANKFLLIIVVFVAVAIAGTVLYFGFNMSAEFEPVACTMEAKLCPDGSYVGRSGPNCEFTACPATSLTGAVTVEAMLNKSVSALGVTITPREVVQDSRCPVDVQCIQAGTVQLRGNLSSGLGTADQVFTLGQTVTTEAEEITLDNVLPAKYSMQTIASSDYRFFFVIKKRAATVPPAAGGTGVFGKVLLGPTCPVERIPPDPECAEKPYQTTIQIIKVRSSTSAPFSTTKSDLEGNYSVLLPPGEYALQPIGGNVLPSCSTKEVTVIETRMIEVNLMCDTGIR